jgi:hypothetical protein
MGEYINLISAISNIECRINNYAEHSFGVGKKMQNKANPVSPMAMPDKSLTTEDIKQKTEEKIENKANDKIGKIAQALL